MKFIYEVIKICHIGNITIVCRFEGSCFRIGKVSSVKVDSLVIDAAQLQSPKI